MGKTLICTWQKNTQILNGYMKIYLISFYYMQIEMKKRHFSPLKQAIFSNGKHSSLFKAILHLSKVHILPNISILRSVSTGIPWWSSG